jgi:hypothetical protein
LKLEEEPKLCGKLTKFDNVSVEAIMIDGCHAAVDTLRALARHRGHFEEFLCAKVLRLRANQQWFAVKDDARYQD